MIKGNKVVVAVLGYVGDGDGCHGAAKTHKEEKNRDGIGANYIYAYII